MDLFTRQAQREQRNEPLAARMRPQELEAFFGQEQILGEGTLLRAALDRDAIPALVLWGPPGCGKTTLAAIIAHRTGARFVSLSAVGSGVKELREVVAEAAEARDHYGRRTILFIDEIHRFNKAQQDALLPHVERGTVVLIGATTENPSFEVNAALLSRVRVLQLHPLSEEAILQVLRRALAEDRQLRQSQPTIDEATLRLIAQTADGDARRALTTLELAVAQAGNRGAVGAEEVRQALQRKTLRYDKAGDEHYDIASAFIKSLRGSDPDAALYWMMRMLEAGEDPRFVARRMVIFASEDIGNADPQALPLAMAGMEAVRAIGLPEADLNLSQVCTYLATAPKSNASLLGARRAQKAVREHGPLPVPLHLRNAPTSLMKAAGYGKEYRYPHDYPGHHLREQYRPDEVQRDRYYQPSEQGAERGIAARLRAWWRPKEAPE